EVEADEVRTAPRSGDSQEVLGTGARVARDVEAAKREARSRKKLPDTERRDDGEHGSGGEAKLSRTAGRARRSGPRAKEGSFPLGASHGADTPRRTSRRLPRPASAADRRA